MDRDELLLAGADLTLRLNRGRKRFSKGADDGIGATRTQGNCVQDGAWVDSGVLVCLVTDEFLSRG